jgi:hypothetical protein
MMPAAAMISATAMMPAAAMSTAMSVGLGVGRCQSGSKPCSGTRLTHPASVDIHTQTECKGERRCGAFQNN